MIKPSIPFPRNETNQEKLERIRTTQLSKFEKMDDGTYKYWAREEIDAKYEFNIKSDELFWLRAGLKPGDADLLKAEAELKAIKNWYAEKGYDLPEAIIQFNDPNNKWEGMKDGYMKKVRNYEREQRNKSEKERSAIENEFSGLSEDSSSPTKDFTDNAITTDENSEKSEGEKKLREEHRLQGRDLSTAYKKIKKLTKRNRALSFTNLSDSDILKIIDNTRKINGTINYAKAGVELGVHADTVRRLLDQRNLTPIAKLK